MLNHSRRRSSDSGFAPGWAALLIVASCLLALDVALADPAPNLRARTLKGKTVQLSELIEEGPVLLQFWRSCCHPCHRALTHLQKIHQEFSEQGLMVVAISVDQTRNLSKAASLVRTRGYTFTVLFDPNQQAFRKVLGRAVPHTLLISADGRVVYSHVGFREGDELKWLRSVEQIMAEWTAPLADSTAADTIDLESRGGDGAPQQ